jgi:hypothetical protein
MLERPISGTDGGASQVFATATATANQLAPSMLKHPGCAAMWPTPSANNYEQADLDKLLERRERIKAQGINGNGFGLTLGNAVKAWATPTARDHKGQGMSVARRLTRPPDNLCSQTVLTNGSGALNPTWVEWLMAWPLGWTVSKHWVTVKSRSKRPSHGESSQAKS